MKPVLHYIHDPLCGWCYAAEPLVDAIVAAAGDTLALRLHGGGLFSGQPLSPAMRRHIRTADQRIGDLSGQVFGSLYVEGLLGDATTVYDSVPPIAAILAAESIDPAKGREMLRAVQHAHYRWGRRVAEAAVLTELAASIGLDPARFEAAWRSVSAGPVQEHLQDTRRLMARIGCEGFPALVLQTGSQWQVLRHEADYGRPAAFAAQVLSRIEVADELAEPRERALS